MYPFYVKVPSIGFAGGLWVLWKTSPHFQFEALLEEDRFIHGLIKYFNINSESLITFVYGLSSSSPSKRLKKSR